jgi:hypothetical protein
VPNKSGGNGEKEQEKKKPAKDYVIKAHLRHSIREKKHISKQYFSSCRKRPVRNSSAISFSWVLYLVS